MTTSDDPEFPPLYWPDPELPSDEQARALGRELGWIDENGVAWHEKDGAWDEIETFFEEPLSSVHAAFERGEKRVTQRPE